MILQTRIIHRLDNHALSESLSCGCTRKTVLDLFECMLVNIQLNVLAYETIELFAYLNNDAQARSVYLKSLVQSRDFARFDI
jgi:hypothetical protein